MQNSNDKENEKPTLLPGLDSIVTNFQGGTGSSRNTSLSREGYGFRPRSGMSTPQIIQDEEIRDNESPIPDQYGLGWPGLCLFLPALVIHKNSDTLESQLNPHCLASIQHLKKDLQGKRSLQMPFVRYSSVLVRIPTEKDFNALLLVMHKL
jgi:hypothetical protein